jgi:hypothetical protein
VLSKLHGAVNKDGRQIAALFLELPKRSELPDYYNVIARPINAHAIEEKLDRLEYPSVLEFASDVHLMIDNAVRYYSTSAEVTTLFKSNLFFCLATKGLLLRVAELLCVFFPWVWCECIGCLRRAYSFGENGLWLPMLLSSQPTGPIQMCLVLSWIILKVFCCGICAVDGLLAL